MSEGLHQRLATVAAVFVVASGMCAGRADAQIPAADGQFYACVRIDRDGDEGKLTRLVAADEPCRRNEKRVHWSATGPQGLPGINGINGTNGTNGKDGVNGTNGTNGTDGVDGTGATRAAGPCFDNTNRYVNCGNGTVTDTVTGLIWLQDAACLGSSHWDAANGSAAILAHGQCGLTDGSSAGDWRLPTKDEWSATIAAAVALGCKIRFGNPSSSPSLTNDAGNGCLYTGAGTSFTGVVSVGYWSSTSVDTFAVNAWSVFLNDGVVYFGVGKANTVNPLPVWPVRSGSR